MRLKDSFFKIIDIASSQGKGIVKVKIDGNHQVFSGHFPGKPVVPGMFTLRMIAECLSEIKGKEVFFPAIRECKLPNPLLPENDLVAEIDMEWEGNRLNAVVRENDKVILRLKSQFSEADG